MENILSLNSLSIQNIVAVMLEQSFEAVIITDGNIDHHLIQYVNPKFCQMTGYTKQELIGQSPSMMSGPKTNAIVIKRLKEALRNGQPFVGSTTNYKKNGDAYPIQWNIYPVLDENGVTEFFVSIQKDLSVLKNTLTSLKSSSEHFKKFLSQISVAHKKHRDEIKIEELDVADITMALKGNVELLSEYVNPLDSDDEDDDFDFFDFDDDATSDNHTMENAEKISSADYLRNTDISEEQISEIRNAVLSTKKMVTLFELEYFSEVERAEFIHDLHEIANAMFFLEEFIDISGILGELTVVMIERQKVSFDLMTAESLKGLISDLDTWFSDVFETKTSSDIHWLDNSIIGSCKQLLVFLRLSEKVK